MKVLQLPDVLHEYLVHVVEKHANQGIHPDEALAVSKLWDAVTKKITHIDDTSIEKMVAAGSPLPDGNQSALKPIRSINDEFEGCVCSQDEHHRNCPAIVTGKCHYQSIYTATNQAAQQQRMPGVAECAICLDEEGSYSCLRAAHRLGKAGTAGSR